ncbi:unnamed protein product [Cyprideis torosa]|uniref:Uncharacterized protein n=1 Tax=Cyprideis torosa TaxID=163714 RepID=A0A7R8WKS8_9CRUS|nr:unnamed protein product [Cyprideis torosa]CAG0897318.1 unnamed protein product [Cyprideis torosa]
MRCLAIVTLVCGLTAVAKGLVQVLDVYDQAGQLGNYARFYDNCADLGVCAGNWDNRIKSACVYGVWIWFENRDYNPTGQGGAEYAWGSGYCFDLDPAVSGRVSSLRYAGNVNDNEAATISLFNLEFFQGAGLTASGNLENISGTTVGSIIITGYSAFTVYSQSGFAGVATCLPANDGLPVFWANAAAAGIESVGSVMIVLLSRIVGARDSNNAAEPRIVQFRRAVSLPTNSKEAVVGINLPLEMARPGILKLALHFVNASETTKIPVTKTTPLVDFTTCPVTSARAKEEALRQQNYFFLIPDPVALEEANLPKSGPKSQRIRRNAFENQEQGRTLPDQALSKIKYVTAEIEKLMEVTTPASKGSVQRSEVDSEAVNDIFNGVLNGDVAACSSNSGQSLDEAVDSTVISNAEDTLKPRNLRINRRQRRKERNFATSKERDSDNTLRFLRGHTLLSSVRISRPVIRRSFQKLDQASALPTTQSSIRRPSRHMTRPPLEVSEEHDQEDSFLEEVTQPSQVSSQWKPLESEAWLKGIETDRPNLKLINTPKPGHGQPPVEVNKDRSTTTYSVAIFHYCPPSPQSITTCCNSPTPRVEAVLQNLKSLIGEIGTACAEEQKKEMQKLPQQVGKVALGDLSLCISKTMLPLQCSASTNAAKQQQSHVPPPSLLEGPVTADIQMLQKAEEGNTKASNVSSTTTASPKATPKTTGHTTTVLNAVTVTVNESVTVTETSPRTTTKSSPLTSTDSPKTITIVESTTPSGSSTSATTPSTPETTSTTPETTSTTPETTSTTPETTSTTPETTSTTPETTSTTPETTSTVTSASTTTETTSTAMPSTVLISTTTTTTFSVPLKVQTNFTNKTEWPLAFTLCSTAPAQASANTLLNQFQASKNGMRKQDGEKKQLVVAALLPSVDSGSSEQEVCTFENQLVSLLKCLSGSNKTAAAATLDANNGLQRNGGSAPDECMIQDNSTFQKRLRTELDKLVVSSILRLDPDGKHTERKQRIKRSTIPRNQGDLFTLRGGDLRQYNPTALNVDYEHVAPISPHRKLSSESDSDSTRRDALNKVNAPRKVPADIYDRSLGHDETVPLEDDRRSGDPSTDTISENEEKKPLPSGVEVRDQYFKKFMPLYNRSDLSEEELIKDPSTSLFRVLSSRSRDTNPFKGLLRASSLIMGNRRLEEPWTFVVEFPSGRSTTNIPKVVCATGINLKDVLPLLSRLYSKEQNAFAFETVARIHPGSGPKTYPKHVYQPEVFAHKVGFPENYYLHTWSGNTAPTTLIGDRNEESGSSKGTFGSDIQDRMERKMDDIGQESNHRDRKREDSSSVVFVPSWALPSQLSQFTQPVVYEKGDKPSREDLRPMVSPDFQNGSRRKRSCSKIDSRRAKSGGKTQVDQLEEDKSVKMSPTIQKDGNLKGLHVTQRPILKRSSVSKIPDMKRNELKTERESTGNLPATPNPNFTTANTDEFANEAFVDVESTASGDLNSRVDDCDQCFTPAEYYQHHHHSLNAPHRLIPKLPSTLATTFLEALTHHRPSTPMPLPPSSDNEDDNYNTFDDSNNGNERKSHVSRLANIHK